MNLWYYIIVREVRISPVHSRYVKIGFVRATSIENARVLSDAIGRSKRIPSEDIRCYSGPNRHTLKGLYELFRRK